MKKYRALLVVLMLAAMLLSACGAGAAPMSGAKVEPDIILTGAIESMTGIQWVVNGQAFTVEPAVVHNGPYNVSDVVRVEGSFQSDGSVLASSVETPSPNDLASATPLSNSNTNDNNSNTNNGDNNSSNGGDNDGSGRDNENGVGGNDNGD